MIRHAIASSVPLLLTAVLVAQATHVEVPEGRAFSQNKVLTLGLTDTWEIDVAADEFLHCVIETSEFDPVLELVDPDGERLGLDDGEGSRSELRLYAPRTGKLVFRVTGYDGRGGGSYRFWLQRYRTERLAVGASAEHVFGRERWWHYRVAVRQGDVVIPRVPVGGRLTAVLDVGQQLLPEWHGGYTARRDGDVLVRVEGNERDRCQVDVQLARQLTLCEDGGLDAELPAGGMDLVRHRFAPGAWAIEIDTPDAELAIDFRDRHPAETPRLSWTGQLEKNGRRRQWLVVHRPVDAELLLRNHGNAASYRGRVVRIDNPVELGSTMRAELPLGGGQVFELQTRPGQLVKLTTDTRAFDARVDLWLPDGSVQRFDDRRRLDLDVEHTFLITRPGTYRVLVYTAGGAGSGPFALQVESLPIPRLAVGESLPIRHHGGASFAHLPLGIGQEVWLSLRSGDFDAALSVHDPDGEHIGTFEGGGVGGDVLIALAAKKAGIYTLQIHSRRGSGGAVLRAVTP